MPVTDKYNWIKEKLGLGIAWIVFFGFIALFTTIFTGVGEFLWSFAPASDKYSLDDFIIFMAFFWFGLYVYNKLEKIGWEVNANKYRLEKILDKINRS